MAADIACILLAAGASRRFGEADKLLEDCGGKPLLALTAETVAASRASSIIAVLDRLDGARAEAIASLRIAPVAAPPGSRSMPASIATGIAALIAASGSAPPPAAMILPADLPGMTVAFLDELIAQFIAAGGDRIVAAAAPGGPPRSPVIWPPASFGALRELPRYADPGSGARSLLDSHADTLLTVPAADPDILADIDTPHDLARFLARMRQTS